MAADTRLYSAQGEKEVCDQGVKKVAVPNRSTKSEERKKTTEEALVQDRPEVAHGL